MVTHQLQVRCRPVKVRRSETDVLPLSHPSQWTVTRKPVTMTYSESHEAGSTIVCLTAIDLWPPALMILPSEWLLVRYQQYNIIQVSGIESHQTNSNLMYVVCWELPINDCCWLQLIFLRTLHLWWKYAGHVLLKQHKIVSQLNNYHSKSHRKFGHNQVNLLRYN